MPRCELTDDGTMDTVIRCADCGAKQRYNYDASMRDDVSCDAHDTYDASCADCRTLEDTAGEADYDAFVEGCIEDMESEHECPADKRLIALGFDRGTRGCSQCQALSINGVPCHETGCPNITHDDDDDSSEDTE